MSNITRQSTTDNESLHLLGLSQWVFNSNCGFIIEMIDKEHHNNSSESWFDLVRLTGGNLKDYKKLVSSILGENVYVLFDELVNLRNAIMHSLPTGEKVDGYYISHYRNKDGSITKITKSFLLDFIKKNEELSLKIHTVRGY